MRDGRRSSTGVDNADDSSEDWLLFIPDARGLLYGGWGGKGGVIGP